MMKAAFDQYKDKRIEESNLNQSDNNIVSSSSNFYRNNSQNKS